MLRSQGCVFFFFFFFGGGRGVRILLSKLLSYHFCAISIIIQAVVVDGAFVSWSWVTIRACIKLRNRIPYVTCVRIT